MIATVLMQSELVLVQNFSHDNYIRIVSSFAKLQIFRTVLLFFSPVFAKLITFALSVLMGKRLKWSWYGYE
jgi:hypothetical protein